MLRKRAIRALLIERIAGMRPPPTPADPNDEVLDAEQAENQRLAIEKARSRAFGMAGLAAFALVILFVGRDSSKPFLRAGTLEEILFTLGVVAVAGFAGYRLAQAEVLGALRGLWGELE